MNFRRCWTGAVSVLRAVISAVIIQQKRPISRRLQEPGPNGRFSGNFLFPELKKDTETDLIPVFMNPIFLLKFLVCFTLNKLYGLSSLVILLRGRFDQNHHLFNVIGPKKGAWLNRFKKRTNQNSRSGIRSERRPFPRNSCRVEGVGGGWGVSPVQTGPQLLLQPFRPPERLWEAPLCFRTVNHAKLVGTGSERPVLSTSGGSSSVSMETTNCGGFSGSLLFETERHAISERVTPTPAQRPRLPDPPSHSCLTWGAHAELDLRFGEKGFHRNELKVQTRQEVPVRTVLTTEWRQNPKCKAEDG